MSAVHCTVEENAIEDTVSEFLVREHQLNREADGWLAYEEEIVSQNTSSGQEGSWQTACRLGPVVVEAINRCEVCRLW